VFNLGLFMGKKEIYQEKLKSLDNWETFLLQESGLPGPRGNLELAHAVAEEGNEELFEYFLAFDAEKAPTNSPYEFLAFCGVLGLGKLLSEGKKDVLEQLRSFASDPRWRTREAVAMALQRFGKTNMDALLEEMEQWSTGNMLERRAAVAALCEPALLREERQIQRVLHILQEVTASLLNAEDRRSDAFKALRKGLGYCWSVAVVALPEAGKRMMEQWFASENKDVRWVMKENLKKKRLLHMDADWVNTWKIQL
jgi:hypothetical protein